MSLAISKSKFARFWLIPVSSGIFLNVLILIFWNQSLTYQYQTWRVCVSDVCGYSGISTTPLYQFIVTSFKYSCILLMLTKLFFHLVLPFKMTQHIPWNLCKWCTKLGLVYQWTSFCKVSMFTVCFVCCSAKFQWKIRLLVNW